MKKNMISAAFFASSRMLHASLMTPMSATSTSSSSSSSLIVFTTLRSYTYSPFDAVKREKRKRDKILPSERLKAEKIVLPKTLQSGRFEGPKTIAEKDYDKMQSRAEREADRRFSSKVADYREVQDPDPYSNLFGETKQTKKVRVKFWQKQFEEENKDVWLPYERDSWIKRTVPNWFVKNMVKTRDGGGYNSYLLPGCIFLFMFGTLSGLSSLLMTPQDEIEDSRDIR